MNIINSNLQFKSLQYGNKPNTIILHNADAPVCSIYDIHQWHLSNGWAGCGYHYLVRKDGSIYSGRPENSVGAHCLNHNTNTLGICAEGKYISEKEMPQAQKKSIVELGIYLKNKYGISKIVGHNELNSTDCPGTYYPLSEIKSGIMGGKTVDVAADQNQPYSPNVQKIDAYGTVTANSGLNVRNEPSTNGSVLGTLPKDTKVHIGGKLNGWYNIFFGSNGGWVSGEYINLSSGSSSPAVKQADNNKYGTVTANSGLNVRSGPGAGYGIVGVLNKGAKVKIGGHTTGWYNIFFGDHGGWVSDKYLQV